MYRKLIIILITIFIIINFGCTSEKLQVDKNKVNDESQGSDYISKTDACIDLFLSQYPSDKHLDFLKNGLGVSVRFEEQLSTSIIEDIENDGITFQKIDGTVVHSGNIYGVDIFSIDHLDYLKNKDDVKRIEASDEKFSEFGCPSLVTPDS
jgi:hypothetical protein